MDELLEQLERRLQVTAGLDAEQSRQVALEVIDVFELTVDTYIAKRHATLQQRGYDNTEIYTLIQEELSGWRFAAPQLTLRQIRRRIYG